MDCANLDQYLESYLEGTLRRAEQAVLRRHMVGCKTCRERVDRLRRFETDLHRRFRTMARNDQLWSGISLDLVGSSDGGTIPLLMPSPSKPATFRMTTVRPPAARVRLSSATTAKQPKAGRSWVGIAAISVAVAATIGAAYQFMGWGTRFDQRLQPPIATFAEFIRDGAKVEIAAVDPARLHAWFAERIDIGPAIPAGGQGFELVGGLLDVVDDRKTAAYVYSSDGSPVALYQTPKVGTRSSTGEPSADLQGEFTEQDGYGQVSWHDARADYAVVGAVPRERLVELARSVHAAAL